MPTKDELTKAAKIEHDGLTESYYSGYSELTKAQFEALHAAIWDRLEADLIAYGYKEAPIDYKKLFAEAGNTDERVQILANKLNLRE